MPIAAGIGALVGGAATAAGVGYSIANSGGSGTAAYQPPQSQQTPQEQQFYALQTLIAENAANTQAQESVRSANAAFESAQTSNSWFKYALTGGLILALILWVRKNRLL
jgi:hypothetical protein